MRFSLMLLCSAALFAQGATRTVALAWTASTSTGVNGYNVYRATSASGPFTLLNTALVTVTSYSDLSATVGQTYTYEVAAVAPACTPTTPATTPCGQSPMSVPSTTTVPPQPAVTVTVTVAVP